MDGQLSLIAWLAAFLGSHFLLSHPLRRSLVARLGEKAFLGFYSAVSLVTFVPALIAYGAAPQTPVFTPPAWTPLAAVALMLPACVLLVGSFLDNPALPGRTPRRKPIAGVFALTRHPLFWGIALWSAAHLLANGDAPTIWLSLAMGFLALAGAAGQDAKKRKLIGLDWISYMDRTSFWPFGQQLRGRLPWSSLWPGFIPVVGGAALYVLLVWAHPMIAGVRLPLG